MMKTRLPKLPMLSPCSHYRYEGDSYGCAILGECKPIQAGPDLSACPSFHGQQRKPTSAAKRAGPQQGRCVYLGDPIKREDGLRETVECPPCAAKAGRPIRLPVVACGIHGRCTIDRRVEGAACCNGCGDKVVGTSKPPLSILITGGIGDVFAIDSFMTLEDRERLETVYYACPAWREIGELLRALPNFPRLKNHVTVSSSRKTYCSKSTVESDHGDVPCEDWSIAVKFPMFKSYIGSSFLTHRLAMPRPTAMPYVIVCPSSSWGQWEGRAFDAADWQVVFDFLEARKMRGMVLQKHKIDLPTHPLLDYAIGKPVLEAMELFKGASGYLGIDTCWSVLAAKLFPILSVKSVNDFCRRWRNVYYAPRKDFGFINNKLQPPRIA